MKSIKKKLKLLLSKEEGKINKVGVGILGTILFFNITHSEVTSGNLKDTGNCCKGCKCKYLDEGTLFDINGNPNPQHLHNIIIKINNTEPSDISFNQQIPQSCLIITEVGGSGNCGSVYWNDITGDYNSISSNTYKCEGNSVSKICWIRGNADDYGYIKYEWHNNDPNFDCNSQYGTFYTEVKSSSNQRVNTWKNVI